VTAARSRVPGGTRLPFAKTGRSVPARSRKELRTVAQRHGDGAAGEAGGQQGEELTVEFTVLGRPFLGLNGGPNFKPNEAVSFVVLTDDQEQTDRYWNAITQNGGAESACGWCKDRWGFSWQITPRRAGNYQP